MDCKLVMGHGHLGVVLLPSTDDSFDQPQINFYTGAKKNSHHHQVHNPMQNHELHDTLDMLIFGGSKFKEREPNENEYTDLCLTLRIAPQGNKYELRYLPGAKLRCADKFFGNMQTRVDIN